MVLLKNKYVIGTHVMWFEIEMFTDFIDGLINLMDTVENKDAVLVDLCFNLSQKLEKIDTDKIDVNQLLVKFSNEVNRLKVIHPNVKWRVQDGDDFYFHADYRRDLNYNYCKKVDYVMWGETDSFFPKEAFQVIETLSEYTKEQNIHRYLLSFADRKMWDSSWDPLVHVDYESHVFVDDDKGHLNPKQAKSQLSIKKMNEINANVKEFDFTYITKPKISGACLVLSSDLIKCGVNIPLCLLYNDDEGLSIMCEKLMGQNFIQFVCKNILHVHARRHPNKRLYVKDENNPYSFIDKKNFNFQKLKNLSKQNIQNLMEDKDKFYEYNDLKKILEKNRN
jgi:DNA-binding MltR family transcriptional regulator